MKFSKSILLFTSLFLLVSCGRSRFPNNNNNDNNDNNNENNNNNDNNDNDETTNDIDNEKLIKKLQEGYVANVTIQCLDNKEYYEEAITFFAPGVCGIEGTNYVKGENGDAYRKTLDFQNNITYDSMNMAYDEYFINGYRLLDDYKFENNELVIDDPKIQSTLFYSTLLIPYGMSDENLIMEKAILQHHPEKNPKLCLEFQMKQGGNEYRKFKVTAEYISFDYSYYLVEKLPTLPEQDRIGDILDKLRSLDSYTIYYPAYDTYFFISQNILFIKNAYDSDNHQYFDYYYSFENDDIECYVIKDNAIADRYSCYGDSSFLRPNFAFAKEVLVEKSEDVYAFNPKITSRVFYPSFYFFLPRVFDLYRTSSIDVLELHTANDDRFVVTNLDGVYAEYYDYDQTSIPQEYIDLVNSYNQTEN